MDWKTGYAVVTKNQTLKIRLAYEAAVDSAELLAIYQALSFVEKETKVRWVISLIHFPVPAFPCSNPFYSILTQRK
jgi:hypothetical protein